MTILPDALDEARRIIAAGAEQKLTLRLLGGLAIKMHSPSAAHRALVRTYPDLDFAFAGKASYKIEAFMPKLGYEANQSFNLFNGAHRLLFYDEANQRQIDVFVGSFHMCHDLPITQRIAVEPLTLPLAELLLTKLQIVQMNEKDIRDICALLLDHPFGETDQETINLARVTELCAGDWGLWKTVTVSLAKVQEFCDAHDLDAPSKLTISERLTVLRLALDDVPKPVRWKMRATLGDKVKWYDLPEEVKRG